MMRIMTTDDMLAAVEDGPDGDPEFSGVFASFDAGKWRKMAEEALSQDAEDMEYVLALPVQWEPERWGTPDYFCQYGTVATDSTGEPWYVWVTAKRTTLS